MLKSFIHILTLCALLFAPIGQTVALTAMVCQQADSHAEMMDHSQMAEHHAMLQSNVMGESAPDCCQADEHCPAMFCAALSAAYAGALRFEIERAALLSLQHLAQPRDTVQSLYRPPILT